MTVDVLQKWWKCRCGRSFDHLPALTVHSKFCKFSCVSTEEELESAENAQETPVSVPMEATEASNGPTSVEEVEVSARPDLRHLPPPTPSAGRQIAEGKYVKRRKTDGRPKQSGLRQGMHKTPHSLLFKLRVALECQAFMEKKEQGQIKDPLYRTSNLFNGLSQSNIWNWYKQLDSLKSALTHENSGSRNQKHLKGKLITFSSKKARQMTLHAGRQCAFLAAEQELESLFKIRRKQGKRVNERWLVVTMRKLIREHFGDEPADGFKGSYGWVWRFAHRHGISLRRANNHKHQSVEERLPRIKRWHARLRRRLSTPSPGMMLHPTWGRWLPKNRLSIDQVGINSLPHTHTYYTGETSLTCTPSLCA